MNSPLANWLESAYIIPKKTQRNCRWRLRRAVRLLSKCLDRPATVADLRPDVLPMFEAWLNQHYPGHAAIEAAEQFRTLCRFVGTMRRPCNPKGHVWNPDADGEARKVSDREGTLWHICRTLYFPRAIRITSGKTRDHYRTAIREFSELLGRDPTPADLTDDNCTAMLMQMRQKGRAAETTNNTVGRIKTLWDWLARRRMPAMLHQAFLCAEGYNRRHELRRRKLQAAALGNHGAGWQISIYVCRREARREAICAGLRQ